MTSPLLEGTGSVIAPLRIGLLQGFRTMIRVVGLADARDWLRSEDVELDHALGDLINKKGEWASSGFWASIEEWIAAAEDLEEQLSQ